MRYNRSILVQLFQNIRSTYLRTYIRIYKIQGPTQIYLLSVNVWNLVITQKREKPKVRLARRYEYVKKLISIYWIENVLQQMITADFKTQNWFCILLIETVFSWSLPLVILHGCKSIAKEIACKYKFSYTLLVWNKN